MSRNTETGSMQHSTKLCEKLALMKIAHDDELNHANGEAARAAGRITSLENELEAAPAKVSAAAEAARKNGIESGRSEAIKRVSGLLDNGLGNKAAERLTSRCTKAKEAEAKRLEGKIKTLQKRVERRPTDESKKALAKVKKKLADIETEPVCLARRQRVRWRISQRRWSVAMVILAAFLLAVLLFGMNAKREAARYRTIIIATASDGLHSAGSLSADVWNDMLEVYNDEYGTNYRIGR